MEITSDMALQDCDQADTMMELVSSKSDEEFEQSDVEITRETLEYMLMDGYQYRSNRMIGNAQRWTCSNTSCYAYFKILDNELLPGVMGHCHPREDESSVQDELKGIAVPEQVSASSTMPKSVKRVGGKKRKHTPKSGNSPLLGVAKNNSKNLPGSVKKKKLARQRRMISIPARSFKVDSGLVLDQYTWEAQTPFRLTATSPSMLKSPSPPPAMSRTPSPAKSPKLSEVGPPPTPPPNHPSPLSELDHPCSPGIPEEFDLSELKYTPPSESPDYYFCQSSISNWTSPQDDSHNVSAAPQPSSLESERFKYKEYEDMMMQLNNGGFGHAVTSLLNELSSHTAERVRCEVASLLYKAVEQHTARFTPKS